MDTLGWQALLAAEVSPTKGLALLKELGSLSSDWTSAIQRHPFLSPKERERSRELFEEKLTKAQNAGVRLVRRESFPPQASMWSYPPALFAWGDFECSHLPCIAIVGTRAASTYGKAVAMKFAEAFARAGVTVVSGVALGIDAAAHRGTLAEGGKTIAVLAGGIEQVYPAVHSHLFRQIRESGCLVSQHAVGSRPNGYRFLMRNHLIAALSLGVVVVEAPERSGALATAHAANDQGKQVFVVPANIENANFKGSHALIRDGATLVDHPDQVLAALQLSPHSGPARPPGAVGDRRQDHAGDRLDTAQHGVHRRADGTGYG
jgi:DNA processing protein